MNQFADFGLPSFIIDSLDRMQITEPTPIQRQSIPVSLKGKDLLASAQTGTGKTIAYLLPVIAQLNDCAHGTALILAPTRELADQIKNSLLMLIGKNQHRDVALLIGGAPIYKQFIALKKRPRFIIGTPGRIIDHLERGSLSLAHTRFLILDETDRMLDMGFSEALETIARELPDERQTMMFSATMPANIIRLSQKYLKEPEHIKIGEVTKAATKIEQKTLKTTANEKFPHLLRELEEREGSVIIFVRTKISAAQLADKLNREDHRADAIHGDLRQRQRDEVIRNYRSQKSRILVATDIAARGLDIPHIMHVINYDLPQCPEDYIHRIGRTGRAGMEGHALSFVAPSEGRKWQAIYQHVNHGKTSEQPSSHRSRRGGGNGGRGGRSRNGERFEGRRPQGERPYGRKKPYSSEGDFAKPRRSEGEQRSERRNYSAEGDSKPRRSDGDFARPRRNDGEARPEKRSYSAEGGFSKPRRNDGEARPEKRTYSAEGGFAKPRRNDGERRPEKRTYSAEGGFAKPRRNDGEKRFQSEKRTYSAEGGFAKPRRNDGEQRSEKRTYTAEGGFAKPRRSESAGRREGFQRRREDASNAQGKKQTREVEKRDV